LAISSFSLIFSKPFDLLDGDENGGIDAALKAWIRPAATDLRPSLTML